MSINKEDKKNILINDKHFKIPSLLLKQSKEIYLRLNEYNFF